MQQFIAFYQMNIIIILCRERKGGQFMKRNYRIIMGFAMVLLLSILFSTVAYANSAEPPSFTVIVSNPLEDLSLSLRFANEGKTEAIVLNEEHKAWETYYRFFYHMSPVSYTHLRAHETRHDLVCRLLLE